ncbi:MAG: MBOAT family protein [Clostridia bacterium]|nr:MBOAT family protein [Clostridia bacterium]
MVFSSVVFLCLFLPAVLLLDRVIKPVKGKNLLLTAASLLFYAYGEPVFVFVLIFTVLAHYLGGLYVLRRDRYPRILLAVLLTADILLLFCFKYAGFAVSSFNDLCGLALPVPQIRLPVGISFFTFQIMSYAIDTYRDRQLIHKSFADLLLYISFFPQLIAGPIVRYAEIAPQLRQRSVTGDDRAAGMRRFICGLAKKVLIANTMAAVADTAFALEQPDCLAAWVAFFTYALQIYYDFSGYSDMAIGIGRMLGFRLPENFNYPYAALSVTDFWRRWHISLTAWFRAYVYIPMGGNRKGRGRTYVNIFIVFLLTGIWHGASYTYILWGLYFAALMIAERSGILPIEKIRFLPLRRFYTIFVVCAGFVLFRAKSVSQALSMLRACVSFGTIGNGGAILSKLTPFFLFIFIAAVVGCFPVAQKLRQRWNHRGFSYALAATLLVVCVIFLTTDSYNPFIYFNF